MKLDYELWASVLQKVPGSLVHGVTFSELRKALGRGEHSVRWGLKDAIERGEVEAHWALSKDVSGRLNRVVRYCLKGVIGDTRSKDICRKIRDPRRRIQKDS